jgi:hypothetical protein
MTYVSGGLIEAVDYNGFVGNTTAGLNRVWSTGAADFGYGQTSLATVSVGDIVTATEWASLVNTLATTSNHQGTAITSRVAPVTGDIISILANISTDITSLTNSRGNAVASGSQFTGWTGTSSKTSSTGSGSTAWTITFTHTITWTSAAAARYFFNAGGRIKWETSKTSVGQLADAEWNDLANTLVGDIFITGGTLTQTIVGVSYTGTTKSGGTGTPDVLATTTGWYDLTTSDTTIYRQYADTAPYTGQYIQINSKTAGSGTQLVLTTTWVDPGGSAPGSSDVISGGTATSGITFGTAPATVVTYFPPSTTYLSNTWGTPTVAATTV